MNGCELALGAWANNSSDPKLSRKSCADEMITRTSNTPMLIFSNRETVICLSSFPLILQARWGTGSV